VTSISDLKSFLDDLSTDRGLVLGRAPTTLRSIETQTLLQIKNTTVKNHKYRLVFMASKETKDSCYIVTAFDKFRVQLAAPPRPDAIQVSNFILCCESG
jgi:hypothetical protein